jgi:hypothetical protein
MAKKSKACGAKKCICSKCLAECKSTIPGKPHRRCPGGPDQAPRPKSDYIPGPERGTWEG